MTPRLHHYLLFSGILFGGAAFPGTAAPMLLSPKFSGGDVTIDLTGADFTATPRDQWRIIVNDAGVSRWKAVPFTTGGEENPLHILRFRIAAAALPAGRAFFRAYFFTADKDGDGLGDVVDPAPQNPLNNTAPLLEISSGNDQYGITGRVFDEPLTVRVLSSDGRRWPLPNVEVVFKVFAGGGKIAKCAEDAARGDNQLALPFAVRTNEAGYARIWWKCGASTVALGVQPPAVQRVIAGIVAYRTAQKTGGGLAFVEFRGWRGTRALPDHALRFEAPCYPDNSPLELWPAIDGVKLATALSGQPATTHPVLKWQDDRQAVFFNGDNVLNLPAFTPGTGTVFSVGILYRPVTGSIITSQPASLAFDINKRLVGKTGQRYLLAGEIERGTPPWVGDWTVPPDEKFSIWRNYKYTKAVNEFTRHYLPTREKPTAASRPADLANAGWQGTERDFDNTADNLCEDNAAGVCTTQRPHLAPSDEEVILKRVKEPKLAITPGWTFESPVLRQMYTRYIEGPLNPPYFTAKTTVDGRVHTEETYYVLKATKYAPPGLGPTSLPPDNLPAKAGWALSAGGGEATVFELQDAEKGTGPFVDSAGYYPSLGSVSGSADDWRFLLVVRNGKANKLEVFSSAGIVQGTTIASYAGTVTPPVYVGSQFALPGSGFKGYIAQMYFWDMDILATDRENNEDLILHRFKNSVAADRNHNGIPDLWERHLLLEAQRAAYADPDGDGWTNLQEFQRHTDPLGKDSDGDGIVDALDVRSLDNAIGDLADSDGDGFPDGHDNGAGQADLDNDGEPDGWKVFTAPGP